MEPYKQFTITLENDEWVARLTNPNALQKKAGVSISHTNKQRLKEYIDYLNDPKDDFDL